jgi:restriction system protein
LSETEVRKTIEMIESGRLERSLKTHRDHVQHVKKIVQEKRNG